ncbi:MAG: hypothetical protein ACRDOS_09055 [Gaiellaceae bacterium]
MDEQTYEEVLDRLRKVNAVIQEIDPSIRGEAFAILRPYVEGKPSSAIGGDGGAGNGGQIVDTSSAEAFVRSQTIDTPGQVVVAIAAWWFNQYGSAPIKREDLERIAGEIGLTVSGRPDNTLRALTADGRPVFRLAGRGAFVPTVPHGELFFQTEYGVTKGRSTPPPSEDS